jgi:hypothetical protein
MMSIPQLTSNLQYLVGQAANQYAHTTQFIRRKRAFDGAQFVQTLVFGWLANPDASLEMLCQLAHQRGVTISPQGLSQRFTPQAIELFRSLLYEAMRLVIATQPSADTILKRFPAVYIQDSTTISFPDLLAEVFHGCGGSRRRSASSAKMQLRLDLLSGQLHGPLIQDGRDSDRAVCFVQRPVAGALVVRDLGYFQLQDLAFEHREGRLWISRLKPQTNIWLDGSKYDMPSLLKRTKLKTCDYDIELGADQRIPCRLLLVRLPKEKAQQRRKRIVETAKRKNRHVTEAYLKTCEWTIVVTNVPREQLGLEEAIVLLKARWQIELLFKLWKSQGGLDRSRGKTAARIQIEFYAKWIALLIQHWFIITSSWHFPDRSMQKCASCIRDRAQELLISNPVECFQMMAMIVSIDTSIHQRKRGKWYR